MNKRRSCAEQGGTIQEPDDGRTEVASPAESWLLAFVSLINFYTHILLTSVVNQYAEKNQCSSPKTPILRKPCLQGLPLVGVWEVGFGEHSHLFLTAKVVY